MADFVSAMAGYYELIGLEDELLPQLTSSYLNFGIRHFARENLQQEHIDGDLEVYSYLRDDARRLYDRLDKLEHLTSGLGTLSVATLLSMVSTFDTYVSETVRRTLQQRSDSALASGKMISVQEIMAMSSFDQVIDKALDDEIDQLMRGSHDEQVSYIEKNLSVSIKKHYDRWPAFLEIFERRNIAAHGGCIVNRHYIRGCKAAGFNCAAKVGDELPIDAAYLNSSADILLEFGLALMLVLWRKHFKSPDEDIFSRFGTIAYDLIRNGRSVAASRLLDLALNRQGPQISESLRRVMMVNLAIAYKKSGDAKSCDELINADWSALSDNYKAAVAGIKENVEAVVKLMERVVQSGSMTKQDFREWPAFDWVRGKEDFSREFERIFGEPLVQPRKSASANSSEAEEGRADTIH